MQVCFTPKKVLNGDNPDLTLGRLSFRVDSYEFLHVLRKFFMSCSIVDVSDIDRQTVPYIAGAEFVKPRHG